MKKTNWQLLLLSLTIISSQSFARGGIREQDPMRSIEMTQRMLELRKEQEYINEQLAYPTRKEEKVADELPDFEDGVKYNFNTIEVVGTDVLSEEVRKVTREYENTPMGKTEMYELLMELSNLYLGEGYMTTLVTVKSGNVKEGKLVYEVKEGKFKEVKYLNKEASFLDKVRLNLAFPISEGDPLTSQAMDQGIENINIGGRNNVVEVSATEEYGFSNLTIEEDYSSTGFSFGVDNSGYADKGRVKTNINFSQSNLLGINDMLTLNYVERLTDERGKDKESNYDIGYTIPVGYWSFSYGYNLGDNYNTTVSDIGSYKSESKSQKHKFTVKKILSRGERHKTTMSSVFTFKDNHNTMNDLVLDVSTKKYSSLTFGLEHTDKLLGGTIFGSLKYERGLPLFGAEADPSTITENDYKVEYDKYILSLNWMKMFQLGTHGFQYKMGVGGEYSSDRLMSSNQFSMGDEFTVRGFKESSVAGNKGIYVNNTITYMGSPNYPILSKFQPFIGLDGGMSRDMDLPSTDRIAGFAVGVTVNLGGFSGSVTYGVPLKWAEGMPKEDNPIYASVTYSL